MLLGKQSASSATVHSAGLASGRLKCERKEQRPEHGSGCVREDTARKAHCRGLCGWAWRAESRLRPLSAFGSVPQSCTSTSLNLRLLPPVHNHK